MTIMNHSPYTLGLWEQDEGNTAVKGRHPEHPAALQLGQEGGESGLLCHSAVVVDRGNVRGIRRDSKRRAGYKYGLGWARTGLLIQRIIDGEIVNVSGAYPVLGLFQA